LGAVRGAREGEGGDGGERLPRLPPGRHGLTREFVTENQRDRLAAGMIAAVAEHGYHEATMTQIAAAAGVSRRTFYLLFSSKDECFFETYDLIADHLHRAATEAGRPIRSWPERLRARLQAVLEVFAENPDLARFVLIAPPRAGEAIAARFRKAMDEVLVELTGDMPKSIARKKPSRAAEHALVGGGVALIVAKVEAGEGERLAELLPDLTELALTPYIGRSEAAKVAAGA
jgi:AcrR family transcriptional regulator